MTKKNLPLVLNKYQQAQVDNQTIAVPQEFPIPTEAQDSFPPTHSPKLCLEYPGAPVPPDSPLYIHRPPIEQLA